LDGDGKDIKGDNDGARVGAPEFDTGKVGRALSPDGTGDYYITTPGVINGWPAGTIDLWVKFNSLGATPAQIFSSVGFANGTPYYPIQMWADITGFTFGFCVPEGTDSINCELAQTLVAPVLDRWYHLAGTWGSEKIELYVNGNLGATIPLSIDAPAAIGGNWIGASVDGLIDEVEIFTRALPLEEIQRIYQADEDGKCKNRPPVAQCKNVTVSAGPSCTAEASIDLGSYDPDLNDAIVLNQSPAGPYPLGVTMVTLTVSDSHGASDTCTAEVTVVDNTPPTISGVTASPATLWPPNHKMVPVRLTVVAFDNCDMPKCGIVSITSNEPVNGLGDGDTAPDWEFFPGRLIAHIRAERSGKAKGEGRIYTIGVQCSDGAGNESRVSTVKVRVPHDQRPPRDPRELTRKKFKAPR
jgi:hypothetical protein